MPYIRTTTSVRLDREKEEKLRSILADAVSECLGKDPFRMMSLFESNPGMSRGRTEDNTGKVAFVECKFFGGDSYEAFEAFDSRIKKEFCETLELAPENIYIKYEVINGWGHPANIFKI